MRCVPALVRKVRQAWACELMTTGTLKTAPKFGLEKFLPLATVHPSLVEWVAGGWKKIALVLFGDGNLGKTQLACALIHHVSPGHAYHFINKVDRLRDVMFSPGEGLVVDEVCLASRSIDDVKGLLDLEEGRDIDCRNRDGFIPMETPRAFLTNWPWEQFWPREALGSQAKPVTRRILWVAVEKDLRLVPTNGGAQGGQEPAHGEDHDYDAEDVFGHGVGMG